MVKSGKDQLGGAWRAQDHNGPAIILVTPQLGENIGGAARAMLNFGLSELRLVAPRDGWPSEAATAMAAGAGHVLENARLFETTEAAVADLSFVMAATARRRDLEIPVLGSGDALTQVGAWTDAGARCGILFGPEKAGLVNDDIVLCDYILTYPINPAFQSLNLAQAVGVFSYLWAARETTAPPPAFSEPASPPASREDLMRMFTHLEDELLAAGFFYPPEKHDIMKQNIRAPLTRARMTDQEVRTMRGMIKALVRGRGRFLRD